MNVTRRVWLYPGFPVTLGQVPEFRRDPCRLCSRTGFFRLPARTRRAVHARRLREGRLDDGVAGLGLHIERDIRNWQIGLSLAWRYRTDWDLTARTPSIQSITNVFSDVETRSVLLQTGRHWWHGKHRQNQ